MKHVVVVVAIFALSACLSERAYVDPNAHAENAAGHETAVNLSHGAIKGDFGPRTGFDGPSTTLAGTTDTQFKTSAVTIARSEQTRGTGMVLMFTNGVTLDELTPGRHDYTFDADALEAPPISMNVCSGNDPSSIDYDRPVDHVTATITDGDAGRTVALHTETHTIDPQTGAATDGIETSDASFVLPAAAAN